MIKGFYFLPISMSSDLISSVVKGILENKSTGETGELQSVSMIGRSAECQVLMPDPRVSRRHAMIRKQDGGFYLFDLGSFNGSYLNGVRVTAARRLETGDVLNFADHEYVFTQDETDVETLNMEDLGGSTIALIRHTPVIVLVSDIKGFTALSEKIPSDDLAQIIGGWYADCEEILSGHGATVDKFIGDCVLAYWTEVSDKTQRAALLAAKELIEACKKTYESRTEVFEGAGAEFDSGLALHVGKVAYGGMSSGEFTLVGDPVNLTFRLESMTRKLDHSVLVSGEFANEWPEVRDYCERLGSYKVKGRDQEVEVLAVTSYPE